jgi:uncharacterized protein (DUF58 family)
VAALARADRRPSQDPVLRKVKQVEIKARILADDLLLGTYRSVFRGWGLEFEEVREYEPGDDIRTIDWNVTARMGMPFVKKFREERELNIYLVVDISASSWFGTVDLSKRELGADIAALLAVAGLFNGDRVGLVLFSDGVRKFLRPRAGREHLLVLVRELVRVEPRRARTDVAAAARFVANVTRKRSVVFFLSDFLDSGFETALRMLGRKHDLIALTLNDPREQELPAVGLVALEDAESGAVTYLDTDDRRLREAYEADARERRAQRGRAFGRLRIDSADLWTDRPYVPALMALFNSRMKRN